MKPTRHYSWEPGDVAAISIEHAKEYGLPDHYIDIVRVNPNKLWVSARGKKAWVPKEIVGRPEDFGIIDDTNYFRAEATTRAFRKLLRCEDPDRLRWDVPDERYLRMARNVFYAVVNAADREMSAIRLGIAEEDRAKHRRILDALQTALQAVEPLYAEPEGDSR